LQSEGWITADWVLTPECDAAHVHWGGDWRMPTTQEFEDLNAKCDWSWTTMNGVNGYIIRGKGNYSSASIFLPCNGIGLGDSLSHIGSCGNYRSSVLSSNYYEDAWFLFFDSSSHKTSAYLLCSAQSVRPLQSSTK
jgi:hypothetical protein